MKNTNEPAFSFTDNRSRDYEDNACYYGLSKREYFAAKAMQGALSNTTVTSMFSGNNGMPVPDLIAEYSLQYADALLSKFESEP